MTDEISDHAAAYDFVQLGEGLAKTLLAAAQEQVSKANQILDQAQSTADIILNEVRAQARRIEEMNDRYKAFGEQMLDAHRKLNGEPPTPDFARLRAIADDVQRFPTPSAGLGTLPAELTSESAHREHVRKQRAQGADGRDELQRPVAAGEPHAPWVGHGAEPRGNGDIDFDANRASSRRER
jgi:hypothetical protein